MILFCCAPVGDVVNSTLHATLPYTLPFAYSIWACLISPHNPGPSMKNSPWPPCGSPVLIACVFNNACSTAPPSIAMTSTVRYLMRVPHLFLGVALDPEWTNDRGMEIKSHGRSPTLSAFLLTLLLSFPTRPYLTFLGKAFTLILKNRSTQDPPLHRQS